MSNVYFVPADASDSPDLIADKLSALWRESGLEDCFHPNDLAALKLHVGEPGTKTFVRPHVVTTLVKLISATGARPFLTDTSVLYKSPRDNGPGHTKVAIEHGFGFGETRATFLPADGLNGSEEIDVEVGGKHYDKVAIASAIMKARSMLVLTHATGHLGTGFGGALKNLGMGCCSKKGKLRQHHGQHPRIDPEICIVCEVCAAWCPADAIAFDTTARIDKTKCIGCGECVAACLEGAVSFDWAIMGPELQERIVEHAAAVVRDKPDRIGYITVVMSVTQNCDCLGMDEKPLFPDIGILASDDPVAIDRAVLDLVDERTGSTLEAQSYADRDGSIQISYAQGLGLGESDYGLVTVSV